MLHTIYSITARVHVSAHSRVVTAFKRALIDFPFMYIRSDLIELMLSMDDIERELHSRQSSSACVVGSRQPGSIASSLVYDAFRFEFVWTDFCRELNMAGFTTIEEAQKLPPNRIIDIIGLVEDALDPKMTTGSSIMSTFTLSDKTYSSLKVRCFRNERSKLPVPRQGDVVVLRNVKVCAMPVCPC